MCRSVRQTPQASTRSSTSPGPALGTGASSTVSEREGWCRTAARTLLLLVHNQLELQDPLVVRTYLDRLAQGLVRAQKPGIVHDRVGVHLVPCEEPIAAGRDPTDREM